MENYLKFRKVLDKVKNSDQLREDLKKDPRKVFGQEGVLIEKKIIKILENSASDFYFIVPHEPINPKDRVIKLSSKPSLTEIGRYIVTNVQGNTPIGKKLLANPIKALEGHGIKFPKTYKIHMIEAEKDCAYFVLPSKYEAHEELNDLELRALSGGEDGNIWWPNWLLTNGALDIAREDFHNSDYKCPELEGK